MEHEFSNHAELRQLIVTACADDACDEQVARLDELVRDDAVARGYAASVLEQVGFLRAAGDRNRIKPVLDDQSSPAGAPRLGNDRPGHNCPEQERPEQERKYLQSDSGAGYRAGGDFRARGDRSRQWLASIYSTAIEWGSLAVAVAIGAAAALLLQNTYQNLQDPSATVGAGAGAAPLDPIDIVTAAPMDTYVARLVSYSGNLWSEAAMLKDDARIREGQSMSLSEGFGQVVFDGGASLRMEGPAALKVYSDCAVSLEYGRLLAVASVRDSCRLETSLGELTVLPGSSVGITLYGSELQVFVREGKVVFDSPHLDGETIALEGGDSRRFDIGADGGLRVLTHTLGPEGFPSEDSMSTDRLRVAENYVAAVRESQPLAYWRFDAIRNGRWLNDVDGASILQMHGTPKLIAPDAEESFIEFGIGDNAGSLVSDAPLLSEPLSDYTVELWAKPSHFHTGAIVSLVVPRSDENTYERHAMLLELQGPQTALGRNLCVRFLHRPKPGTSNVLGVNCYSSDNYRVRRWQHIVARREGSSLGLFVDGKLVSMSEDEAPIPAGLTLVVGQLYTFENIRPFVGQLDELAVYDRALSEAEISFHYDLIRPEQVEATFQEGNKKDYVTTETETE